MPIQLACPGCGHMENLPDHLMGKKLRCKRCKQNFVVGGLPAPPMPAPTGIPAPPRASAPSGAYQSDVDSADREETRSRRGKGVSGARLVVLLLVGSLVGGGAVAGYLYFNKPAATTDDGTTPNSTTQPKFVWDARLASIKPKDDGDIRPKDKGPLLNPTDKVPVSPTLDNWKKIKLGMAEAEVVALLGSPSHTAPTPGVPDARDERWTVEGREVTLTFEAGKLTFRSGGYLRLRGEKRPDDDRLIDESLKGLKAPDLDARRPHAAVLANLPADPDRLEEVSRALDEAVKNGNDLLRAAVVSGLKNWATKENAPFLLQVATAEVRMGDVGNPLFQAKPQAIEILAQLKDPKALEPALQLLDDFHGAPSAIRALVALGPALGEKEVLKRLHTTNRSQSDGLTVLKAYNTPDSAVIAQTVQDLKSPNLTVKVAAMRTALETPVSADQRKDLCQGVEQFLQGMGNFGDAQAVQVLKKWGGPENLPTLRKLLNSPVPDVKKLSQEAIEAIEMRK